MEFSEEMMKQLYDLAAALTPISDIAVLLDVDEKMLRLEMKMYPQGEIARTYRRAKAETALSMRKQELELAKVGSPLAVEMSRRYLVNMERDEDL